MTSPTFSRSARLLISSAAISVPSSTAPPRTARPIPAPMKKPPKTAVSTRSGVTSGKRHDRQRQRQPGNRRACSAPRTGRPCAGSRRRRTARLTTAAAPTATGRSSSPAACEMPVTPPSMKLLDSRNPLSPIAADRIPSAISAALPSSGSQRFMGASGDARAHGSRPVDQFTTTVVGSAAALAAGTTIRKRPSGPTS